MPIVRISGLLIYFAHVPKCAGSAIERYLRQRFGPLALCDPRHKLDASQWSQSSPQHIDKSAFARLFPPGFCDGGFAVVRHPVSRLRSVFVYQRDIEEAIAKEMSFGDWVADLPKRMRDETYHLDNHPRPMDALVPEDASIFHLEAGLEAVVGWLDEVAGADDGPRAIAPFNGYAQKLAQTGGTTGPEPVITADVLERISEIYAADFDRFGYAHSWSEAAITAPVAEKQAQTAAE